MDIAMKLHMNQSKRNQSGAAIIVCLMLLTIATLIAISNVGSTVMEEKMAGNIRNKHMSFQAAEAGLRAGETAAAALTDATIFNGANGRYIRTKPGDVAGTSGALADYPVWEDEVNTSWANGTTTGLPTTPQFIIEDFGRAPRDRDCGLERPLPPGCMLPIYRITARAEGLNSNTVTMVQSTYKRL